MKKLLELSKKILFKLFNLNMINPTPVFYLYWLGTIILMAVGLWFYNDGLHMAATIYPGQGLGVALIGMVIIFCATVIGLFMSILTVTFIVCKLIEIGKYIVSQFQ